MNGGLCKPCKGGYKQQIEDGKKRREQERRYDQSPERLYWLALVKRVHRGAGFDALEAARSGPVNAVRRPDGRRIAGETVGLSSVGGVQNDD